jgi:hypothetical protein
MVQQRELSIAAMRISEWLLLDGQVGHNWRVADDLLGIRLREICE